MIILTGGAGFIGSTLLASLNEQGISDIMVVDHLGSDDKWKNLRGKQLTDYLDREEFRRRVLRGDSFGKIEAVFHLGACSSTTERDAQYMLDNNFNYSKDLCLWSVKNGARFIYASSAATYGDGALGFDDSFRPLHSLQPLNVYGYSKLLFDQWIESSGLGARVVGLRFFNVYGPNEYHKGEMSSVVLKAYRSIRDTGEANLFKSYHPDYRDGEQLRDFISVSDCCSVINWLREQHAVNGIFNLGTGKARSWNALVEAIFAALKLQPKINYIEMPEQLRGRYQYRTEANVNSLRSAGYKNEFQTLEAGVGEYVSKYLAPGESYR